MRTIGLLDLEPQAGDWDAVERFIYAGRAIFTLRSKRTGRDYTYRVTAGRNLGLYFVDVESGGYLKWSNAGRFFTPNVGRAFKPTADKETAFNSLIWFLDALEVRDPTKLEQTEFKHLGKCGRCGRPLTDSDSIDRGIGPDCWEKMEGAQP